MNSIKIIDNRKIKMVDELNHLTNNSKKIKIAVAFAMISGFNCIKESFYEFFKNSGEATLLIGLDFQTTDPDILWELKRISETGNNLSFYCFRGNLEGTATYHPKLYIFQHQSDLATYIVGSSNLTRSGLEKNIEVNVEVNSTTQEEHYSDVIDLFNQLVYSKNRILPDKHYIETYSELYFTLKKGKDIKRSKALNELTEIEKSLPRPQINKSDLAGWMKLVYNKLPDGQFSTNEIYTYAEFFKQYYPDNHYIEAKIRQQLQYLQKFGLVEKLSRNSWKKSA